MEAAADREEAAKDRENLLSIFKAVDNTIRELCQRL